MIILYTIYVLYYWFNVVLSSWSLETAISMIQLLYLLATWPAGSFINDEYERYSINAYCFPGSHMNNIRREKSMANESEKNELE